MPKGGSRFPELFARRGADPIAQSAVTLRAEGKRTEETSTWSKSNDLPKY